MRVDFSPLRDLPSFRRLLGSGLVSGLGSAATYVAMPFQIADLTGSYVAVGVLGIVEVVPLVAFGLWGGVVADRHDRKRIVLLTEVAMLSMSLLLVLNTVLWEPRVWAIYVVSMLFAALDGIQRPSLDALLPRLVPQDRLASAGALQSMFRNVHHIVGPAFGGLLIAFGGVEVAYGFDALTFVASALLLLRVGAVPAQDRDLQHPLREIREAFSYVRGRRDILGTYAVDTVAMVFAFPYALFPFIAREYDAQWALGFLYSSFAAGSLVVTATSAWTSRVHRYGRVVVLAATAWGVAIAASGLVHDVRWVIVFFALAGAADMVSGLFRSLLWNSTIPDEIRGRMAGLELLSYGIGPQLGQVRSTLAARLTSVQVSLTVGGAICASSMPAVVRGLPEVWRFDARTDEHAVRRRADADPA